MTSLTKDKLLASPRLPTLPAVAMRILELTSNPKIDLVQVSEVIRNDQALAAKVLRTVNSSYYGLSKRCTTIRQAIVYLGLNAVKTLALSFTLVDCINGLDNEDVTFDFLDYWRRALHTAAAARQIARFAARIVPEEAFLAALLQDVGMVALYRALGDRYLQCIDLTKGDHRKLVDVEQNAFALDHAAMGSEMAQRWNLPVQFVYAIQHHHDSKGAPENWRDFVRVVELAGVAAAVIANADSAGALARFNRLAGEWFNLSSVQTKALVSAMHPSAREFAALLRVGIGTAPEIDSILEEAEERLIAHQASLSRQLERPRDAA